jgi:hypothetical protein
LLGCSGIGDLSVTVQVEPGFDTWPRNYKSADEGGESALLADAKSRSLSQPETGNFSYNSYARRAAASRNLLLSQKVSFRHNICLVLHRNFGGGFSMRSLATAFSLALAVLGVTIASIGPAAAARVITPEPMTGLVFGAGLVGAALLRRRNKK